MATFNPHNKPTWSWLNPIFASSAHSGPWLRTVVVVGCCSLFAPALLLLRALAATELPPMLLGPPAVLLLDMLRVWDGER